MGCTRNQSPNITSFLLLLGLNVYRSFFTYLQVLDPQKRTHLPLHLSASCTRGPRSRGAAELVEESEPATGGRSKDPPVLVSAWWFGCADVLRSSWLLRFLRNAISFYCFGGVSGKFFIGFIGFSAKPHGARTCRKSYISGRGAELVMHGRIGGRDWS